MAKTLILGIGNTLLADEGAGIHAIHYLEKNTHSDDIELLDGGTLSFTLAGPIEEADQLIVIDAAELDSAPGTVKAFIGDDMDIYLGSHNKRSVHEVGLIDLMTIARLTEHLPVNRALIGIQPESVDWGEHPTSSVEAAIPNACQQAIDIIGQWQS